MNVDKENYKQVLEDLKKEFDLTKVKLEIQKANMMIQFNVQIYPTYLKD